MIGMRYHENRYISYAYCNFNVLGINSAQKLKAYFVLINLDKYHF